MSSDKYEGMRRALTLAMLTGQTVNVGLNRGGAAVKIEGVIEKVYSSGFAILLEPDDEEGQAAQSDESLDIVCISEVEYVEYS